MTQPDPTPDASRPASLDLDLAELDRVIAAVDAANRADAGTESSPATRAAILAAIGAYEMATWRHGPALVAEVKRLRALVDSLAERCARQSEALARRAEAPVPRPLFEAALRVLRYGVLLADSADSADRLAIRREEPAWNFWSDREYGTVAERLIRRAAACGVGEDG